MRHSSDSVQSFLDTLTAVANTTTVQITRFFSTFIKHLKGLLSGMSCKTSTLSDFSTKPSEFGCGWNMQNKPPKASSISVLFCFENMRRDERLCSVFFCGAFEQGSQQRCSVALLCDAGPSTACRLVLCSVFFFGCLYWFTQMHTTVSVVSRPMLLHSE